MGSFSLGCAHEFEITATKAGWKPGDLDRLAHDEALCRQALLLVRGQAYAARYVVDCGKLPWCPKDCNIAPESEQVASRVVDVIRLTSESLSLHFDPRQIGDGSLSGNESRAALAGVPVLPANVLDYLLEHQELIPRLWSGKRVFFWGTVFMSKNGGLFVLCLQMSDCKWAAVPQWIDDGGGWGKSDGAAVYR